MDSPSRVAPSVRAVRVRRDGGELYRLGQRVRLQEKPRQILVALLERPGEIASREELRERLWKTDTFVDFEHGLNTAINKVRQALGDSADAPEFVETLARRGYRFIAPVSTRQARPLVVEASAGDAPADPAPGAAVLLTRGWERRRIFGWGAALFVVIVAAAVVWVAQQRNQAAIFQSARPGTATQLAVLPLRVLAGSGGQDSSYIGIGIADAITTRLANIQQIGLRPTSAVLPVQARAVRPCARCGGSGCALPPAGHGPAGGARLPIQRAARAGGRRGGVGSNLRRTERRIAASAGSSRRAGRFGVAG